MAAPATDGSLTLFLDLGDVFTKALALGQARRGRARFPSIVAHALLRGGPEMATLTLDKDLVLPRLSDFDAKHYPRTRSFAGSDDFVRLVQGRPPTPGARFAGGLAAVYGVDRQLLGLHPTPDHVDALVRKAFLLVAAGERCAAKVVFVTDMGRKADVIRRYAQDCPRELSIEIHNYRRTQRRKLEITLRTSCTDATECARAALAAQAGAEPTLRTLIIDVGYLRTKFAIISREGCEHQEQTQDLGVSDCVYRILRDGQEQGLVEDEFAVLRALESSPPERLEVTGRRFDVRQAFEGARRALLDELLRAARRIIVDQFGRRGEMCSGVAVIGGGAIVVGAELAERLKVELGLRSTWVAESQQDLLLDGARKLAGL